MKILTFSDIHITSFSRGKDKTFLWELRGPMRPFLKYSGPNSWYWKIFKGAMAFPEEYYGVYSFSCTFGDPIIFKKIYQNSEWNSGYIDELGDTTEWLYSEEEEDNYSIIFQTINPLKRQGYIYV